MSLLLIVAMDENGLIGKDNDLPWRLPNDLKRVKELTVGHPIVLGRKNYESIGRPLPKRRNLVLTRDLNYRAEGCEMVHSRDSVLKEAESTDVFIFGGAEIYRMFLPYVETMYITRIHHAFEGDTYFPDVKWEEWEEVSKVAGEIDDLNTYFHTFFVYKRKSIGREA